MTSPKRQKKKTAKSMLIKGFLQSFFIVTILLGAAAVGYQTTLKLWSVTEKEPVIVEPTPTPEPITIPSVDEVSKNLIYCYDKEDHRISRLLLEVFNCQRKELAYLTIPLDTQLTMSDTLYRKLVVINPEMPQIIKLSSIAKYMDEKAIFDYGVVMTEELLGIDISYYTVIPDDIFTEIFEERVVPGGTSVADFLPEEERPEKERPEEEKPVEAQPSVTVTEEANEEEIQSDPTQVFAEQYIEKIRGLDTKVKIETYLEELYPKLTSNLPLQDKINYIESYSELTAEHVIFLRLAGEERNSGFTVDLLKASIQLQELTGE